MNDEKIKNIADHLSCMAYQLYSQEPDKVLPNDEPFSMFSYDRIVRNVLSGMIINMLGRGFTEAEVVEVLQSKQVRWCLDANDEKLVGVGMELAKGFTKGE